VIFFSPLLAPLSQILQLLFFNLLYRYGAPPVLVALLCLTRRENSPSFFTHFFLAKCTEKMRWFLLQCHKHCVIPQVDVCSIFFGRFRLGRCPLLFPLFLGVLVPSPSFASAPPEHVVFFSLRFFGFPGCVLFTAWSPPPYRNFTGNCILFFHVSMDGCLRLWVCHLAGVFP